MADTYTLAREDDDDRRDDSDAEPAAIAHTAAQPPKVVQPWANDRKFWLDFIANCAPCALS